MALFTVDSSNTFGQTVEEAGSYNVVIAPSSQVTKTQQAGKPMAVFDYEVVDGKYKGGQIRFDNMVWDGTTEEKAKQSAKRFNTLAVALGATNGTSFDSVDQFVSQTIGHQLALIVDWEVGSNGKAYLTVKGYKRFMTDGSKPNGVTRPNDKQATSGGFGGQAAKSNSGFGGASPKGNNGFDSQPSGSNSYANNGFDSVPGKMPF